MDTVSEHDREAVEELLLENKTINALIKGLEDDLETFKREKEVWTPSDTVRFTMQLNILNEKKKRNLASINELVKKHEGREEGTVDNMEG
jgi:anti-sigma-K factor RskA